MKKERINLSYHNSFPNNCPVIEQTADGVEVGVCTFFLPDGKTCPRHGDISQYDTTKQSIDGAKAPSDL
jgi:hypothetical protein